MAFDIWLTFVLAASILCFTPGPTVLLVMGQSLQHGKKSVIPLVAGVLIGDIVAMSVSFAGLGALLNASATLFNLFKWVAAFYLIYLGIKTWRSKATQREQGYSLQKMKVFKDAFIVTALNPKGITFFIAFFPLFMNTSAPAMPQILTMSLSFITVSLFSASFYSLSSGYIGSKIKEESFQEKFNKLSGSMLMTAGAMTASMNK
jgi:threonine/homoserine/homoserine lactone efflux protein